MDPLIQASHFGRPTRIAHNNSPNSCYVAVLLNTLRHRELKCFFRDVKKATLSDGFKDRIAAILRKQDLQTKQVFTPEEQSLLEKIKLHPPHQILSLIKEEIANDLRKAILPCLEKMEKEETVSVSEIAAIQNVMRRYNMIEKDGVTDEDPMGIIHTVLDYVAPHFQLFQGHETRTYDLAQAAKVEDVDLTDEQRGASGVIIVEQNGMTRKTFSDFKIPLSCAKRQVDLAGAFKDYLCDRMTTEATVYVHIENTRYKKYEKALCSQTIRTFANSPSILVLELAGRINPVTHEALKTDVSFEEKMLVEAEDGSLHYYLLEQVNCHEYNHEYAFIKWQKTWYLSDDLKEVKEAVLSDPLIKKYGRTFIYREVEEKEFAAHANRLHTPPYVPAAEPQEKGSPEEGLENNDEVVFFQLEGLATICERLADPSMASVQDLLDLSWGIRSLPKEKKFSPQWSKYLSEQNALLLEDLSRQITSDPDKANALLAAFSKNAVLLKEIILALSGAPEYACEDEIAEIETFVKKHKHEAEAPPSDPENGKRMAELNNFLNDKTFAERRLAFLKKSEWECLANLAAESNAALLICAPSLIKVFKTLQRENQLTIEKSLGEGLDNFVLSQVRQYLETLLTSLGSSDPVKWLQNPLHLKAFFRTLEVVGEGAKLIQEESAKLYPTLHDYMDLWRLLRNALHHNKKRTKDIAQLTPEKWIPLLKTFLPRLKAEIEKRTDAKTSEEEAVQLKELVNLCKQEEFRHIRHRWKKIKRDFLSEPVELKKRLFGLKMGERGDLKIWEEFAKPLLKDEVSVSTNQEAVIQMLRMGRGEFLQAKDLDNLATPYSSWDKTRAVQRMKELLAEAARSQGEEAKPLMREYETLAYQFVFLEKKTRNIKKNTELKELMSLRLNQKNTPFRLSDVGFQGLDALLFYYIQLKRHHIDESIKAIRESLQKIIQGWQEVEISIEAFNALQPRPRDDQKNVILTELRKLQEEKSFFSLPDEEGFKTLKMFPRGEILQLQKKKQVSAEFVEKVKRERETTLKLIEGLIKWLDAIDCRESLIQTRVEAELKRVEDASDPQTAEKIVKQFKFANMQDFLKKLKEAGIERHPFKEDTSSLNDFANRIIVALKARQVTNVDEKVDEITNQAQEELSPSFVQKALGQDPFPYPLELLQEIYLMGLDKAWKKETPWEHIVRTVQGKKLSVAEIEEVRKMIGVQEHPLGQKLLHFLNGNIDIDLSHVPRYEHGEQKVEAFISFLENECLPALPHLEKEKDKLVKYFKKAIGIVDIQRKAINFSDDFMKRINKLGKTFSRILELEDSQDSEALKLLLISGEYDMQAIGELAQLIEGRPALWSVGRHILSAQHLLWLSLMRKMMAHYPLILEPHLMRWNMEYLAFDTSNVFLGAQFSAEDYSAIQKPQRTPITHRALIDKTYAIENHLSRLNLHSDIHVLYPSVSSSSHPFLNPLGELVLMVSPAPQSVSKTAFIHAVMELELALNYELNTKVAVIGEWNDQELVNAPSDHIPSTYLRKLIASKQNIHEWCHSMHAYEIFKTKPWSHVVFRSGVRVTRSDTKLYRTLQFFLELIGFTGAREGLGGFLSRPHLKEHIHACLKNALSHPSEYSISSFFKWIRCLFERLPPPGAVPDQLICLPKGYLKDSWTVMIDQNGLMIYNASESWKDSLDGKLRPYYRGNFRVDFLNNRSLLLSSSPIQPDELPQLAAYAISVLRAHQDFIYANLRPENRLDRAQFSQIERVILEDPDLVDLFEKVLEVDKDTQELIDQEAKELVVPMIQTVEAFSRKYGTDISRLMLEWIKVDKQIEKHARAYFGAHRLRLRGDYIKMDQKSREVFDGRYVRDSWNFGRFPFVNNFRTFINRIHLETHSLQTDPLGRWVLGDFSPEFKALVQEPAVQDTLLALMKQRELVMLQLAYAFQKYDQQYLWTPPNQIINAIYDKWDRLFRTVQSPQVLDALQNNRSQLYSTVRQDLEDQYKNPGAEREHNVAYNSKESKHLYEARFYFTGKLSTQMAQRAFKQLMELPSSSQKEGFLKEWERLFGMSFQGLHFESLVAEARDALNTLLGASRLPTYDFDDAPTFSEYWTFVANNTVRMNLEQNSSGICESYREIAHYRKSFESLLEDPKKRGALEKGGNERLKAILKAYVPFLHQEFLLSQHFHAIEEHLKVFIRLREQKEQAIKIQRPKRVLVEFDLKLQLQKKELSDAVAKMDKVIDGMLKEPFFQMLALYLQKHQLIGEELNTAKLLFMFEEIGYDITALIELFKKAGLPLGKLSLACKATLT